MPTPPVAPRRLSLPDRACVLACGLLVAGGLGLAQRAQASDAAHAPAEEGHQPAAGHAKAAAPKPAAVAEAPKVAERAAPAEPLDRLRERLAEKLGATKAPDAGSRDVVRIVARAAPQAAGPEGRTLSRVAYRAPRAAATPAPSEPAPAAASHAPHWDYQGNAGPDAWGQLTPEFAKCSSGTRQSPIDIRDGVKVQLDAVQFDYKPSGFRVIDNGHTVQVNVGPGNSIEVLGRRYDLLQFHFHRPSEERVNGRQFDMVAHLVHKDIDGKLAVVAVLLDRGSAQPLVQTVWNNLPLEKGEEVAAQAAIDLNALLPVDRSYYTYMGSLTTPPCSEGVLWMVMKKPVPVSAEQIGIFARLYPMNARPVQQAAGRLIKESN